jgi:hypothetical protein
LEADFHFTLAEADDHRVADLIPPTGGPPPGMQLNQLLLTMFSDPSRDPELTKTRAWRSAEMPAISGFGNARSIAKIKSLLANGGIANGKQILSEKTCRQVLELNFEGFDVCTGAPTRQGLGYYLIPGSHVMPSHNIAYGGGFGGSLVVVDFDSRVTCAYVMNKMIAGPNLRGMALTMATWSAMVNRTLAG